MVDRVLTFQAGCHGFDSNEWNMEQEGSFFFNTICIYGPLSETGVRVAVH